MTHISRARSRARSGGFTLLEVAVTIVIVGIGLTLVLQVLNDAQLSAAQTRNEKLARELGLLTLGRVASGLYVEDVRDRFGGSYAEDDHPDYVFEVALGDEVFEEQPRDEYDRDGYYRNIDPYDEEDDDDDEETEQPYERVKVKVSFPAAPGYQDYLILERWIPWPQVYGAEEEEEGTSSGAGASQP